MNQSLSLSLSLSALSLSLSRARIRDYIEPLENDMRGNAGQFFVPVRSPWIYGELVNRM